MFLPSSTAFFALLANCKVEKVSDEDESEGETHTMKVIFPFPERESLKTLVSFEFLNGIWVLFLSIKADMQCPNELREPLMHVNSAILISLSSAFCSNGILNFSLPAKSTILS